MNATTRPSLWKYFILCLTKNYCAFSGTAPRREFWGFYLFLFLFSFIFGMVGAVFFAMSLPWGELAGVHDPAQIQAMLAPQITSFFLVVQIITVVFYLPTWGVTIRRLRDAGFSTAWGCGYIALAIIILLNWMIALAIIVLLNWMVMNRFQYEGGPVTQFLGVIFTAYWLLLIILACFPTRPAVENTPE